MQRYVRLPALSRRAVIASSVKRSSLLCTLQTICDGSRVTPHAVTRDTIFGLISKNDDTEKGGEPIAIKEADVRDLDVDFVVLIEVENRPKIVYGHLVSELG